MADIPELCPAHHTEARTWLVTRRRRRILLVAGPTLSTALYIAAITVFNEKPLVSLLVCTALVYLMLAATWRSENRTAEHTIVDAVKACAACTASSPFALQPDPVEVGLCALGHRAVEYLDGPHIPPAEETLRCRACGTTWTESRRG